jgi:cardiolipin synthase (CMP-forming)
MSRIAGAWYGGIRHGAMARPRSLRNPWQAAPGVSICRSCFAEPGASLNLPNLITIARILLVPVIVWAITSDQMLFAFILFLAAGLSDAVDGFLAKRFGMTSEFGSYLDPLADKALIVSIYVALGISDALPRWLVILVVSRDMMIVAAVMLSWLVGKPVAVKPLAVSKANTVAQIVLATLVLASLGLHVDFAWLIAVNIAAVAALTLLSVAAYVREWVRHMGSAEQR